MAAGKRLTREVSGIEYVALSSESGRVIEVLGPFGLFYRAVVSVNKQYNFVYCNLLEERDGCYVEAYKTMQDLALDLALTLDVGVLNSKLVAAYAVREMQKGFLLGRAVTQAFLDCKWDVPIESAKWTDENAYSIESITSKARYLRALYLTPAM